MSRNRNLANILSKSTDVATDSELGLVHINTTSFSAVASQTVEDVFSATYDDYKIIGSIIGSTNLALNMRLRVSGTDNSSSNYSFSRILLSSNASTPTILLTGSNGLIADGLRIGGCNSEGDAKISFEITNPFATKKTTFTSHNTVPRISPDNIEQQLFGGGMNVTTSYTGFTLLASTGTITGSLAIFGYRKS